MPGRHAYGEGPAQFLELTVPVEPGPAPLVVLLHGGFWRARYGVQLARPLAADLARRGFAAVAVEYRRVGAGGGWPHTLTDVAAALDLLPELVAAGVPGADQLDLTDVAVVGHSAGGQLAVWAAGRHRLPAGAPGAGPRLRVTAAVAQAGVLDLERAFDVATGNGAVPDLLGGSPAQVPDRYAAASPTRLVPTGVPVLCVHGTRDTTVPPEQSERFAAAARAAGDDVDLTLVDADHMALIDPASAGWQVVVDWLTEGRRVGRWGSAPAGPGGSTLGA